MKKTIDERFDEKVLIVPFCECWIWIASCNARGYGHFSIGKKTVWAHRFSYERSRGEIPNGLQIDHLCRTPSCVNPAHLEAVTQRENIMRGVSPPARNAARTYCKRGHEFTSENGYPSDASRRTCRTCHAESQRRRREERNAAARKRYRERHAL